MGTKGLLLGSRQDHLKNKKRIIRDFLIETSVSQKFDMKLRF